VSNEGDLFIFKIPKYEMHNLIFKYRSYAHGTKSKHGAITMADIQDEENEKEYALRPKYGDNLWKELLKFRQIYNNI
jgi:hypothetical protein